MSGQLNLEQRQVILDSAVRQYVRRGYQVILSRDASAQLIKPKSFSGGAAIINVLLIPVFGLGVVLLLLQFIDYLVKRDTTLYLEVDARGHIHRTSNSLSIRLFPWTA